MNKIQRLALLTELTAALASFKATTNKRMIPAAAQNLTAVLMKLGAGMNAPAAPVEPVAATTEPIIEDDSVANSDIVDRNIIDVPEMAAARQHANDAAIALLGTIHDLGLNRDNLNSNQLAVLASYTGNGGGLTCKITGTRGSAYEYYTPKAVADALWSLASDMGFSGGSVLDPSAGTGIFAATSPSSAVMTSIELSEISGGIAQILNDGARSNTMVSSFEAQAKDMPNDSVDMVITNVPFGDNSTRGANKLQDDCFRSESLEGYFILRSLQKLKPGGLAVFITPTSVVSGKDAGKARLRKLTSLSAEFLGAYRMPTSVFKQTGADVVTDVVIYRKHSAEALDQIDDLYQAGSIDTLTETGVFWDEYLSGLYFKGAGKKFVLGDETQVPSRFNPEKLVDTVVSTKPTAEIAKMMRKFDGSRIDWDALGAAEADYIKYENGDIIFQNGQQLSYQDGVWQVMEKEVTDTELEMQKILGVMGSAIEMVVAEVTGADIIKLIDYTQQTRQAGLIPNKASLIIERALNKAKKVDPNAWSSALAAQAIQDVISEHDYGYDFFTNEPALTRFMKTAYLDGKNGKLTGDAKQDHKFVGLHYANGKYSKAWRGEIDTEIQNTEGAKDYKNVLARLQYENKSPYLSREQLALVEGNIDPMTDDDWFISSDGSQVIAANDFLTGNLASRLADIDAHIERATDPAIIAKLRKQKIIAEERVSRIDLKNVDFDLRTPLISAQNKVRFLIQLGYKDAFVAVDKDGKDIADIDIKGSSLGDYQKLANRIGDWIAKGTVTTGNLVLKRLTEREALDWLADTINTANIKFNNWVKANDGIMANLEAMMNADENLFFSRNSDESPIDIAGMNPLLKLHGYQAAEVRSQGRFFGGINGMGVGLGKTFTALASVKHTHNIGAKNKTIFVVPNSVLSNWRKEATFAYQDTSDCLFVGLREKGDKFTVSSSKYDEDLLEAINSKYKKIFMTFEAFKRIRMKDETVEEYANYVMANDDAFASKERQKDNEKSKGLVAELIDRLAMSSSAPFLEDMRIDSVVIDEAHAFKNSVSAPNTGDRIKYLSKSSESGRGEDAQAKLWYIRSLTGNNDGVQLLTATPITNSPLEIYSMLSLAAGRDTVNRMCGGISGADDFINIMCQIEEEVLPTIDGKSRSQNVFTGIRNAQILKKTIKANAVIKDASDVGLSVVIPDREETATPVILDKQTSKDLKMFQDAYTVARMIEQKKLDPELNDQNHPQSPYNPNSPYSLIAAKYGETNDLIAHPFNLIRKMDVMIADGEFSDLASFYDFNKSQAAIAQKAIDQFNKKAYKDERKRLSPYTAEGDYTEILKKENGETILKGYKVTARASIVKNKGRDRIVIDTLNGKIQTSFEDIADSLKLNLDVTISAKVAAMLENFKTEQAAPRGINNDGTRSKIVKQIIFCDHLFLHNKIKRILIKRSGVKANKIAIITGQVNNEPDQMIDIQDGFNAETDDNRYQVIIANKKAEVGINLQRGTQAIHHLTTGWTPDSLEQRNGRGARQGNKTEKVKIFHYDADGTFDEFKRTMIDKKDEWITNVLTDDDKNTIEVSGSISRAEQDALIRLGGDAEGMRRYQLEREANEALARRETILRRYNINMEVIKEQLNISKRVKTRDFYEQAVGDIVSGVRANNESYKKAYSGKGSGSTQANHKKRYEDTRPILIDKIQDLLDNIYFSPLTDRWEPIEGGEIFKPTVDAAKVYDYVETDKRKQFTPGNSGSWDNKLEYGVLRDGMPSGNFTMAFDGGKYQDIYKEVYNTAVNLIKQSLIDANNIADAAGMQSFSVPDNAAIMLAEGKAHIEKGTYFESESFITATTRGNDKPVLFLIGKYDYAYSLTEALNSKGDMIFETQRLGFSDLIVIDVILPSNSEYLNYVKKAAAIEDNAAGKGVVNKNVYSDNLGLVAEYRDTSITATYQLSSTLKDRQHALAGCDIAIMLPSSVLKTGTPFATFMLKAYLDEGISIDADAGTFKILSESIVLSYNYYTPAMKHDYYTAYVSELIKNVEVRIEAGDKSIIEHAEIVSFISYRVSQDLLDEIERIGQTANKLLSYDDIRQIPIKLFDNYLYNDKYLVKDDIADHIKKAALEYAHDEHHNKKDVFDIDQFIQDSIKANR